jgi:isoleucyl-tRNA synthetase
VLKDRLYTTAPKSLARRSAQTALWQITNAMLRWMAPFLSFTAEEAWALFAAPEQRTSGTIFTQTYWDLGAPDEALLAKWRQIRAVRDESNRQIELLRSAGSVGSSLQATVVVSAKPATHDLLASLGDALKLVLITSAAQLNAMAADLGEVDFSVAPQASTAVKCERCWHWRDDVGADAAHPTICSRCVSNLYGAGEQRTIA